MAPSANICTLNTEFCVLGKFGTEVLRVSSNTKLEAVFNVFDRLNQTGTNNRFPFGIRRKLRMATLTGTRAM